MLQPTVVLLAVVLAAGSARAADRESQAPSGDLPTEVAARADGSALAPVGWIGLGLLIAIIIVGIGMSNAEVVSE